MSDLLDQALTAMAYARQSMGTQSQVLERINEKSDEALLEAEASQKRRNVKDARSYTCKTQQTLGELVEEIPADCASVAEEEQKVDTQGWLCLTQERRHLYEHNMRKLFVVDNAVEHMKLSLDELDNECPEHELLERLSKR